MPAEPPGVAILLCADLAATDGVLLSAELQAELERGLAGVRVEVVPDLCRRPDHAPEVVRRADAQRVVFGVCAPSAPRREFQAWTRKAGLDPYAFELVHVERASDGESGSPGTERGLGERSTLQIEAAVARLRAFQGSEPHQLKMRLLSEGSKVSRRSLLRLPPLTYDAVASVDPEPCVGVQRCGLCAASCPFDAIDAEEAFPTIDKARCESCGICVTSCPTGAIGLPGASIEQYEAELEALLAAKRPALVITCQQAAGLLPDAAQGGGPSPATWLEMHVPCMAMVTPAWMLNALAGGAGTVRLLGCGEACRSRRASVVADRVRYVQALLRLLGDEQPTERVALLPAEPEPLRRCLLSLPPTGNLDGRSGTRRAVTLTEPAGTVEALTELADGHGLPADDRRAVVLAHDASPLGLVHVEQETCTMCGACVAACPTGALAIGTERDDLALSFDAALCVNCGRCAPACPEAATNTLSVSAETDLEALMGGRRVLKKEAVALCKRCGRPVAPKSMLDRIEGLLGRDEENAAMLKTLTELCEDCRGLSGA